MDTNELFWATGIDNSGLRANQQEAIQIFTTLANRVTAALDEITQKYGKVIAASKVKFDNPVDPSMISSIKTQIETLGKTIDMEITKLGNFTAKYDQSMSKISKSAAKLQVGNNSPLAPMVAGIQKDVANSTEQLSFLERRFKYAFGSALAYGSMRIFKGITSDIIDVKTQFEFLQTAINSFAGSAEKGAKIMNELTQFAVNSPLQVNDITEAAKQLMAFGVGADNVVGQIKMLSDVAAGAGKPIKEIAYIYGKSLTEGKVYTRTLMQFGNLGIPIYEALAKVMDTTPDKIKKMTQMGAIGFDDIKRAIESLTSAGGQYYGFSAKMMDTTAGLLSNVKDKWILAMKDMGESSDGFINGSVQLVDTAIAHWKELGDAIVVAATAVGTYQVAKMVSSLGTNISTAGANIAEANSLATLISAEAAQGIAKQGLIIGSVEYQTAIKAEIALMLQKAESSVATAQAEVVSATEAVSAQNTLTTSQRLSTAQTELNSAENIKNTLTTNIDTAAKAGAVAGADLLAAAQARLVVTFRTLTATMAANPYTAIAVGVFTLVAAMWALSDSTTEAEKAQRKLKISLDDIQLQADKKNKMFSENLDKIKNKSLDGTVEQTKAYQVLHDVFGAVIGDMTLQQLKASNSVDLQNKTAKAVNYSTELLGRENLANKLKTELLSKQKELASLPSDLPGNTNPAKMVLNADVSQLKIQYGLALNDYNKYKSDYAASKNQGQKEEESKNKEYWTKVRKEAVENLDGIASDTKKILNSGSTAGVDPKIVSIYKKNNESIKQADKELEAYDETRQAKAVTKAQELRNREAAEAAKRLEQIRANNTELANLKSKAETDATQAAIDAMDAGYAKEKAQQQNNFEKRLTSLNSEKTTILKKEQENIDAIFRNMNPNTSKTKTVAPAATNLGDISTGYSSLLKQSTAGGMTQTTALINTSLKIANEAIASYNSEVDSAQKDNDAKLGILLEKQLLEYGDYTAKKTKIEKDYNLTLTALENDRASESAKGNTERVAQIDAARVQAQTNKAKDLMALSFGQLKSTPEFAMAFEDLGNVSTATIEKLMSELEKFKQTAAGTLPLADFKVYATEIGKITDEFIKRNPFKTLKNSLDELTAAKKELSEAQDIASSVAIGGKIESGFTTKKTSTESTMTPSGLVKGQDLLSLAPIYYTTATAADNLTKKENNLKNVLNNIGKEILESSKGISDLSKEMSSLGSVIGGTAGEIISSIGEIGSFVSSVADGYTKASELAVGTMKTLETASVVLMVISGVITIATKIANIFTSASKKRQEEAQKELDNINAVKKAYLEAYAAMSDKSFSNIFGDDVFGKAASQIGLMNKAVGNFATAYTNMVTAESKTPSGSKYFDFMISDGMSDLLKLDKSTALTIDNFDLVAAKAAIADDMTTGAVRDSLQAMVDEYDAYQSYLDEIDSYLSGIFSSLGSNMMDSLSQNSDNMVAWADDVTGYISDSFSKMVKDIIYNMDFASLLTTEQAKIKEILANTTTSDADKEKAMQDELTAFRAQLITSGNQAATDWNSFNAAWVASGGNDLAGSTSTKNNTTSALKSMDQPTADILTAQFSALRIHGANIDTNISRYLPELLLSLQGQAGVLQIAFNDVAEIAKNTRDLAGIKSILSDIKTYGVKVL